MNCSLTSTRWSCGDASGSRADNASQFFGHKVNLIIVVLLGSAVIMLVIFLVYRSKSEKAEREESHKLPYELNVLVG